MKLRIETESGDSLVIFMKDLIPLKDISVEKLEKGYIAFSVKKDTMLSLEREDTRTGKKEIVEQSAENMKKMLENRDIEHKNTQKRHEGR